MGTSQVYTSCAAGRAALQHDSHTLKGDASVVGAFHGETPKNSNQESTVNNGVQQTNHFPCFSSFSACPRSSNRQSNQANQITRYRAEKVLHVPSLVGWFTTLTPSPDVPWPRSYNANYCCWCTCSWRFVTLLKRRSCLA